MEDSAMEKAEKFRLVKVYHKPYKNVFKEPNVFNLGNLNCIAPKPENKAWLQQHMDMCLAGDGSKFSMMNSEWTVIHQLLHSPVFCDGREQDLVSFQHYSKVMDLNTARAEPWHDTTQTEDANGQAYRDAASLEEFGYSKAQLADILSKFDIVVGQPVSVQHHTVNARQLDVKPQ